MTVAKHIAARDCFRVIAPRPAARLTLFCFPHAGGAASSFHQLAALLPDDLELVAVQYPGRQDRYGEPLPRTMAELVDEITGAMLDRLDRPAAFLGHSMGATVAYEVARRLRARRPNALRRFFASARRAPHRTNQSLRFPDDASVLRYVDSLGGTGAGMLADPDLRELAMPVLRGDFRLIADYQYATGAPLTCPITVIAGDSDASFTTDHAGEWARHTVAGCSTRTIPGGHFYTETAPAQLARLIVAELSAELTAGGTR
ncbi:thioesterase [Actinoplanes sp. SE50]|uniref:thioesterase II family protein n=1 Tax=unclassified Actinoplanes TaxID=2626549 RepID=UPI00023EC3E6|nr:MULTISPECIES: alpha/beta fold hydrolase [unclassified Actinoplanes]AEV81916.1 thioesterase [Actinoplanes sp. SE50/110]ATO80316.1 thioesterase [Actinoplanes sp. SE50]SLL97721.1 thioesterase [Actinoplanes sp. SE50/110]